MSSAYYRAVWARRPRPYAAYAGAAVVAAMVWWTFATLDVDWLHVLSNASQGTIILRMMVRDFKWDEAARVGQGLLESMAMTVVATSLAAFLALPFGFLAARNIWKVAAIPYVGKFLLNFIRTFPELLLAIIFFRAVGPGPFAGVLTMGIHSIGMLGKLYGEVVEQVDRGPVEAMQAAGANRAQTIAMGMVPQVLPDFLSYVIFRFEINLRASTILGVVGAGGVGMQLIFAVQDREWGQVGIIIAGVMLMVSMVDYVSAWLRSKLV